MQTRKHISNFIYYNNKTIDELIVMINRKKISRVILAVFLLCLINVSHLQASTDLSTLFLFTSDEPIYVGDSITVTFQINVTESIGGWELSFGYDPTILKVTQISAGPYWIAMFDEGSINHTTGSISSIQSWSTGPYPESTHILCNITFDTLHLGISEIYINDINVSTPALEFINVEPMNLFITIIDQDDQNAGDDTNASSGDDGQSQPDDGTDEQDPNNQNTSNDENTSDIDLNDEIDTINDSFFEDIQSILEEQLNIIIDSIETIKLLPKPLNTSYLIHYQMDSIIYMVVYDSVTHMILPTQNMTDQYINIDIDYDGIWEYSYDIVTGSLTVINLQGVDDPFILLLPWIIVLIFIFIIIFITIMIYNRKKS